MADVALLAVQRVRNNELAKQDPNVLLDVMHLGLTMAQLSKQTRYVGVITSLRARDQLDHGPEGAGDEAARVRARHRHLGLRLPIYARCTFYARYIYAGVYGH